MGGWSLNTKRGLAVAVLAEAGVMVALAYVLSLIKIWHMPYGGAVTAGSMVPLVLLALRRGPWVGMAAGAVFGILDFFTEPYFLTPVQWLLDYPVPFAALGVAGFFPGRAVAGTVAGVFLRFVSHVVSGVVFWGSYAKDYHMTPLVYSIVYNGSYLLPDLVITAVLVALLLPRLAPVGRPASQQSQR
ncbi:MAG: energy-coupled thiamine transporter ThiT [Firmicutes bacterium]|nr:energy-coupled thiamine transporter ThiT [Bacillota bacterium]